MKPWELEYALQKTAIWMHGKQEKNSEIIWWTPAVITNANKDDNPIYTRAEAEQIFESLRKRGLISPIITTVTNTKNESVEIAVFIINQEKKKEWRFLRTKEGALYFYIIPVISYLLGANYPILKTIAAFLATAFFTRIMSLLAEDFYPRLKLGLKAILRYIVQ